MIHLSALMLAMVCWHGEGFKLAREHEFSEGINVEELRAIVARMASTDFAGRRGAGGARASRYVAEAFQKLGLAPCFGDSYYQSIPNQVAKEGEKGNSFLGRNVGAVLPGKGAGSKEDWILIHAHFDHLGTTPNGHFPGADDNASGLAVLMEIAEHFALQKEQPARSIVFVAFDLEEVGLLGSTYFASHLPTGMGKPRASITLDMLGRSMADLMHETVYAMGSEQSKRLRHLLETTPAPTGLEVARLGADIIGTRSDYGPFRDRSIPFLFFSTGSHADYHRRTDTAERLDYVKMKKIADYLCAVLARLSDDLEVPLWEAKPLPPDLAEVRAIRSLLAQVLANPGKLNLSDKQRTLVSSFDERLAGIEKRGAYTEAERASLVWTARLLMATVFN